MHAPILSEEQPTNVSTGKIWIKPSTGQAYIRLGQLWSAMGSTANDITYHNSTVMIDGQDVTNLIMRDSLVIEDILTREVDSCSFLLIDTEGTNRPSVGQEVSVFYKETPTSTPVIRFAGRIDEVPQMHLAPGKYQYEVTCTDYTSELNKHLVVETYSNQTAGDIIRDLVNTYAIGLGTAYVQDGGEVEFIQFNYIYPMECITQIADLIGYDWYVDYERQVHFFEKSTNPAPYELTETASSGDYKDLSITVNKTELKNSITVRGGYEFSALFTQEIVADGTQESFPLRYEAYAPISVYVDIGGGYAAKTLGIDNIDESGRDFVYNSSEKVIKNLDLAILTSGHKLRATYKYKKPILALQEDDASIQAMAEFEGGDGKYEGPLIVDDTIETKTQARDRGLAELNMYSNPLVEGTFSTTQFGYRSGQYININIPSRGYINREYLIQQVVATSIGQGLFTYEVTFATLLKGLTDYLIQLHKDSRTEFTRTDEILDRLKITPAEDMSIAHAVATTATHNITTNPYKWSNDAGTTPDKGQWNKAQWG
jgi:hypothetical protein